MTFMHWSAPEFRIEQDNIALWNAALSFAGTALPIGSGEINLSFSASEKPDPLPPMRRVLLDDKEFGFISVKRFPFETYCGVQLDIEDLEDVPIELADALQEGMLTTVLTAFPHDLATRLKLGGKLESSDLPDQTITADLQWFSCSLTGICDEPIIFNFVADRNDICAQLKENAPTARLAHSALGQSITTRVARLLGSARLAVAELYGLETGDCVLINETGAPGQRAIQTGGIVFFFEQTEDADKWQCVRTTRGAAFAGTASVEDFALKDSHEAEQDEGNEPADDANTSETAALVPPALEPENKEENTIVSTPLEVTVDFMLGATQLPLDEIGKWQPGALVTLPTEISEDRTLIMVEANGSPIAQGDLVRIDNRLAVRLNRILVSVSQSRA